MRFALGMSNREIARALGRTDGATKVLIHRAIKQLQEEIEERRRRREPRSRHRPRAPARRRAAADRAARAPLRPARGDPRRDHRRGRQSSPTGPTSFRRPSCEALRDPRNWVRPVVAVAAGGSLPGRSCCSRCGVAAASAAAALRASEGSGAFLAARRGPGRCGVRSRARSRPRAVAGVDAPAATRARRGPGAGSCPRC